MLPKIKIKSEKTLGIHNLNFLQKEGDLFDNNKYGITRIVIQLEKINVYLNYISNIIFDDLYIRNQEKLIEN